MWYHHLVDFSFLGSLRTEAKLDFFTLRTREDYRVGNQKQMFYSSTTLLPETNGNQFNTITFLDEFISNSLELIIHFISVKSNAILPSRWWRNLVFFFKIEVRKDLATLFLSEKNCIRDLTHPILPFLSPTRRNHRSLAHETEETRDSPANKVTNKQKQEKSIKYAVDYTGSLPILLSRSPVIYTSAHFFSVIVFTLKHWCLSCRPFVVLETSMSFSKKGNSQS